MVLRFLLISDGSSDSALIPIIKYALGKVFNEIDFIGERADFYRVPNRPKTLVDKINVGIDLYQPDIIIVHRDCEKDTVEKRYSEIDNALENIAVKNLIKIVPLRMTEAWLLIDEAALRMAVNNPHGEVKISLPAINKLEGIPDPKQMLEALLRTASELKGRRLDNLNTRKAIHFVADHISDWTPLFKLTAFVKFSEQLKNLDVISL